MKLANMTENADEKQRLMEIAEQEKSHYMMVKDMLESYM